MAVNPSDDRPEDAGHKRRERGERLRAMRGPATGGTRTGRTVAIIVGIVVLVAIAIAAYFIFYGGSNAPSYGGGGTGGGGGRREPFLGFSAPHKRETKKFF